VVLRAAQTRIAPLKAHVTYHEKRPYAGLFFACRLNSPNLPNSNLYFQAKKNRALRPAH